MSATRLSSRAPEAFLLFAVVFGPLAFGATEPWSRAVLELDCFLLAAACALRGRPSGAQPAYASVLPAAAVVVGLAFLQSVDPRPVAGPESLAPFTASAAATAAALPLWLSYAALLWGAPQALDSREGRGRFAALLLGVGALVALVGLLQRGQGDAAYYGLRAVRQGAPFGPFVNRNHAAAFLVMAGLVGAGLLAAHWLDRRRGDGFGERSDRFAARAMMVFALALVTAGAFSAGSRGAAASFCAAAWGVACLSSRFVAGRARRWAARAGLLVAAATLALFAARRPSVVGGVFGSPDSSTSYRLSMYRSGGAMLKDFPVWGVGLGAAGAAYPVYQERMVEGVVEHLHGDWVEFPVELGFVGAAALAAGLAAFFVLVVRRWSREPSRTRRLLTAGAIAGAAAFILHEAVEFSFSTPADAVVFLSLLSYLSALTAGEPARERGAAA